MKSDFHVLLQSFFLKRLMNQRDASPCTIASYRDTFRLLLRFMRDQRKTSPSNLTLPMLDAEVIVDFLHHLKTIRHNSANTINNRLAAIHSFYEYASFENPKYLDLVRKVRSIPFRSTDKKALQFFTEEEMNFLLQTCETSTPSGRRDRVMLLLMYNTGIRVSELTGLKQRDVTVNSGYTNYIKVLGKV